VFALWALLHSLLASFASKAWAQRLFGPGIDRWYRLIYNFLALLTLLPVLVLVGLLPDRLLYAAPTPWSWLMRGVQGLALLGLGAAFVQTGLMHFLGLQQWRSGQAAETGALSVHGLYCRMRHPLYFFGIVLVWFAPVMTANWFAACLMVTAYFYLGALHEEQRLLAEFGPSYAEYRRKVPMLAPRPGRCVKPTVAPATTRSPGP
jgi:protein-S-isoprenylcysteine O-methyltransferase Ste14